MSLESKPVQRGGFEMDEQGLFAFARLEPPCRIFCKVAQPISIGEGEGLVVGMQDFGRMQACQFGAQGFDGQFGDGELAGGDVGK